MSAQGNLPFYRPPWSVWTSAHPCATKISAPIL